MTTSERRLLLVHAHPDDETIGSGATMAKYVAAGAHVTLVTCTLGEEGEIIGDRHAHRAAHAEDSLGEHREVELANAMARLGVTDHRLLGGAGRYRDSGMVGTADNEDPSCFWQADLLTAATDLVSVIREIRPQVLITYDDFGGYGHPDHIQAHRVAHYAVTLASSSTFRPDLGAGWDVPKIYWIAFPKSVIRAGVEAMKAAGETEGFAAMDPDDLPFACDDDLITTVINAEDYVELKMDAMREHATQISVEDGFFALSNKLGSRAMGVEFYRLARGEAAGDRDEQGRETDLFAGL
ncbi:MAG: N-acetyl-1-D-myo-inositol-2-amino-2-deoxy-alpha-D-glucopyranoside deacetylase [Actinomycetes bacterium]